MQSVANDLCGTPEQFRFAAVPQGQQDMAVAGNEDAGLPVLAIARFAVYCNVGTGVARHQRQLHYFGTLA